MTPKRKGSGGALLAALALTALAACYGGGSNEAPPPAATGPTPPPRGTGVFAENLVEGEATIVTVDRGTRLVTLRNDAGEVTTVKAPADADLTRIKAGDRVGIRYVESVAINLADPGTPAGTTVEGGMVRAAPDELPGRAAAERVVVVAEVTAIDLTRNTVTFRGGDGTTRTIPVRNPDLQLRLRNLKVGDMVQFTFTEAAAIQILPKT